MTNKKNVLYSLIAISILALQAVTCPFFANIDMAAKIFSFSFLVLAFAVVFLCTVNDIRYSPIFIFFVFLWVTFFVSAIYAFNPPWAILNVSVFSICLLFLLLTTHLAAQFSLLRQKFLDVLLVAGVFVASLGLYEYIHSLLFGPTRTMLIPYLLPPNTGIRVGGIYGQPNLFAVFLTIVILAFFYHHLHRLQAERSPNIVLRYIPFLLVGFVFFLTGSRGGFLSLALIMSLMAMLTARGKYFSDNTAGRAEFFRLLVMLLVAFAAAKSISLYGGLQVGSALSNVGISTDARFVFWTSAILIFLENPWMGVGLDGFQFFQNDFGPMAHAALGFVNYEAMGNTNWTHNELLQILCEGGIFAFVILLILLGLLMLKLGKTVRHGISDPFFFYSHLLLLPFIFQSMFSWPFRHPGLLFLFFACLGMLLSQYPLKKFTISSTGRAVFILLLIISLGVTTWLASIELGMGKLRNEMRDSKHLPSTFTKFEDFTENPYSSYRILSTALPTYLGFALREKDDSFLKHVLPYYERLCGQGGSKENWYNLALIYFKLGDERNSLIAIKKAITLMPSSDQFWAFLHYLNMLDASRKTGRPLENFWPKGQNVDFAELGLFHE